MKTIDNILAAYKDWLASDGKEGVRANFSNVDLTEQDFSDKNLQHTTFNNVNLTNTNFEGTNLNSTLFEDCTCEYTYFNDATLIGASFYDSELHFTDFREIIGWGLSFHRNQFFHVSFNGAVLEDSSFDEQNLFKTYFTDANLKNISLRETIGNAREIKSGQLDQWNFAYTVEMLHIGWENHPIEQWWEFTDADIAKMEDLTPCWWERWKNILKMIIETSPATR
jgi:uncharacterized protein YjbI with pentapeptide repeats